MYLFILKHPDGNLKGEIYFDARSPPQLKYSQLRLSICCDPPDRLVPVTTMSRNYRPTSNGRLWSIRRGRGLVSCFVWVFFSEAAVQFGVDLVELFRVSTCRRTAPEPQPLSWLPSLITAQYSVFSHAHFREKTKQNKTKTNS